MLIACKTTQEDWYKCLFLKLLCYKCKSHNLLVKILYQLHCFRLFQSSHVVAVCTVRRKQRVSHPQIWQVLEVLESPRNHHPLGDRTPDATCLANCEAKSACQIWSLYNERHNWTGTHKFTQQERTEWRGEAHLETILVHSGDWEHTYQQGQLGLSLSYGELPLPPLKPTGLQ